MTKPNPAPVSDTSEDVGEEPPGSGIAAYSGQQVGQIAARLRRAIEAGVYADGDQLPPERHLATAFETTRSTVRRAIQQLEGAGLVVRRVGSGTFITFSGPLRLEPDSREIIDLISPLQLIETRFAIEPHMARLAAVHATGRDLEMMKTVMDHLDACGDDKDAFTRWDSEFHLLLARCSRNPLIYRIYQMINDVRTHAQWGEMKEQILLADKIAAYNAQHRGILDALFQRDGASAAKRIRAHLETARADLIGADSV